MGKSIEINTENDWQKLRDSGFRTVIDPLVIRAGELFLRDLQDFENKDEAYKFLEKNIYSLSTFIDTLVLSDGIPVFNYDASYPKGFLFGKEIVNELNQERTLIEEIDVQNEAYMAIRDSAILELENIYERGSAVSRELVDDILAELTESQYNWTPFLGDKLSKLNNYDERTIASLMLGGIIFNGYAKKLGGDRIVQPKRSRLFLSVSFKMDRARYEDESLIFEKLKEYGKNYCNDIPWTPSFFPMILDNAKTRKDIIPEILKLRKSSEIKDYKEWLKHVLDDLEINGQITTKTKKEIAKIEKSIKYSTGLLKSSPEIKVSTTVLDVKPQSPLSVDLSNTFDRLSGWFMDSLPGNRYRSLLKRAIIKNNDFEFIDRKIRSVFYK